MLVDELKKMVVGAMGMKPTAEQENAIEVFAHFLYSRNDYSTMILRGCAGTGKTTLASAIVKVMDGMSQNVCLLAPTGRAAKVFSLYSGCEALTIHRKIYRQKSSDDSIAAFTLNFNKSKYTLFIIDESSMISNNVGRLSLQTADGAVFGSGCLLDDLIQYVYEEGVKCRILFMGDKAQLPPVGEKESPALSKGVLEDYGLDVFEAELNEVVRQSEDSGILHNATVIRSLNGFIPPKIKLSGFADIRVVGGNDLIESLCESYHSVGMDETMVVTRSNKRANVYNEGIRRMILDRDGKMCSGDMLLIVKNNYFWVENDPECKLPFIANGDRAVVKRVRNVHEMYGFTFGDVTLEFPDYDDYEMTACVVFDALFTEAPALTHEQSDELFNKVYEDYMLQPNRPAKRKQIIEQVRRDAHYNAFQVKYAYAVTCHKAQGGQWSHVYIDQGYMTEEMFDEDYIHWLYTAFTRATDKLFLVNWPSQQCC